MANPVRIYVFYHRDSAVGKKLTDKIYDWFRMPNLEGIPVYVRSQPRQGKLVPDQPIGRGKTLEYLVPLVDAHMVRDAAWHDYLQKLTQHCLPEEKREETKGWVMFPVAMDGTSYNLPRMITKTNFIRYIKPVDDATGTPSDELNEQAVTGVLKDLTEAMSRDLNARLFPKQTGQKLKIFISYSRADGPTIPKAMRDYIQSQTQCEAFFDETDIRFGADFETVLADNAGEKARALIVVAGDHYADRPICRWEIFKFTTPARVPLGGKFNREVHVFHPVIVLSTLNSAMITRIIPELGQSPTVRWEPGRESIVFSLLMRLVLFGSRNVLAARQIADSDELESGLIVNRIPGPVGLQRLFVESAKAGHDDRNISKVHYPGNGLPLVELQLLRSMFSRTRLIAFRDVDNFLPDSLRTEISDNLRPLNDRVIWISYSDSDELNSLGYLPQHMEEALVYLLRPLLRLGADILYGGKLPKRESIPSSTRNMSLNLMNLLNDEMNMATTGGEASTPSRLFNPITWPETEEISAEDEASWISTWSVTRFEPHDFKLTGEIPRKDSSLYAAWRSYLKSRAREKMAAGYNCPTPGAPRRRVNPAAMILVGGKITKFSGCMPGIIEEFIYGLKYGRPVFLLGGFGGAAGILAKAAYETSDKIPPTLCTQHYVNERHYSAVLKLYEDLKVPSDELPTSRLNWLWETLKRGRHDGMATIFNNGLSDDQIEELATTEDTLEAVHLVWEGLSKIVGEEQVSKSQPAAKGRGSKKATS